MKRPTLRDAWRRLRGGEGTPWRAAASIAVGLAIGVTPLWGFHWAIVLAVCVPLRLDTAVAFLASNISLPFVAPFLMLTEIEIGAWARSGHGVALDAQEIRAHGIGAFAAELGIGTAIFAPAIAAVGGAIAYAVVRRSRGKRSS